MDKYHKINEYIDLLGLSNEAIINYKRTLSEYDEIIELEARGPLNELDSGRKLEKERDLDNFITDFIGTKKSEIEESINKFRNKVNEITEKINKVTNNLILESEFDFNITSVINELHNELLELNDEIKGLVSEIDGFKKYVSEYTMVEFSMNYHEINETLDALKRKTKDLKRKQISMYNARVEYANKLIEELRGLEGLSEELQARIQMLVELEVCSVNIKQWNQKYFDKLDYMKLNQTLTAALEIKNEINRTNEDAKKFVILMDLDSSMDYIEKAMYELENKINNNPENIEELVQELLIISSRMNEFEVKLNNTKELLTDEEYEMFNGRLSDMQMFAYELNEKLSKEKDLETPNYDILRNKLNVLEIEINSFSDMTEALYGNILSNALDVFKNKQLTFEKRLSDLVEIIEKANADGLLELNQYEQLIKKTKALEEKLEHTRENIYSSDMAKNVDIFVYLNGSIDGLEEAINKLNKQIDSYGKDKITDKKVRKEIDKKIERLEKEIKYLEEKLEEQKDKETEKYESTKERLNNVKDKLDKLGKKYRYHCPLLVRGVKEAKNFYKKHKKICLIAAGLAAIALIHATVGPVLIPAIMHGNLMLEFASPALQGFANSVNNILGGLINANLGADGLWRLANGVIINPSIASTSLLKGLAISSIGSAASLAPIIAGVVIGVKNLSQKMKANELKEKLSVGSEKLKETKEKIKEKKEKIINSKEKISHKIKEKDSKKNTKQADRMSLDDLAKLLREYRKSGVSLEEFCQINGLSNNDRVIIECLDAKSKENSESMVNNNRKGR